MKDETTIMVSELLVKVLLGTYLVIMVVSIFEKRYLFALYWAGAAILNFAVLLMSRS